MKKASNLKLQKVVYGLSLVILSACGQTSLATPTPTLTIAPTTSPTSTVTPIPTNTNTPAPTPTEAVKQFPRYTEEQYKEYYVAPADLRAYADWTKEQLIAQGLILPQPDSGKVYAFAGSESNSSMFYGTNKGIPPSERPWTVGFGFCHTKLDIDWNGTPYIGTFAVSAIAFSVPGKPGEIVVNPLLIFRAEYDESEEQFIAGLKALSNAKNLLFGQMVAKDSKVIIKPIAEMNEKNFPELEENMKNFFATLDPTYIDGIIFDVVAVSVR